MNEDYNTLLEEANRDVQNMPKNVLAYRRRGILKMDYQDYQGAIEDFTIAIKMKKKHALTWLNRGICHFELEEYHCAMYNYKMAYKIRPNISELFCEMGRVYMVRGDFYRAIIHCKRAISINWNNFDALVLQGYCYSETKLPEWGLTPLNRALRMKPCDAQARLFRAMIHHKTEKWPEALEDYDIAIAFCPEDIAYLNRAVVKMELGKYKEALDDAFEALKYTEDKSKCFELIEFIKEIMEGEEWKG